MVRSNKMQTSSTTVLKPKTKTPTKALDEELLHASELWTRPEPDSRQTQLSRNEIANKALMLADEYGIDSLSMRTLADALGVGTMTLYSYIRNKDELLLLLSDVVMQKAIVSKDKQGVDWRESLIKIATRTRKVFGDHPWFFDIQDDSGPGPNSIKHYDHTLQVIMHLDISLAQKADILATVYNHIFGYCAADRHVVKKGVRATCIHDYIISLVDSGGYPALREICKTNGVDGAFDEIQKAKHDPKRFERNLRTLLEGYAY